jgi:aryl-alcohol dehydrogenase
MHITAAVSMERDPNGSFVLQDLDLEQPRLNEIVVRLVAAGICGSDLHARNNGDLPRPIVLGHEGAGVVMEIGSAVTKLKVGDHVLLNYLACGKCATCVGGMPKLCPDYSAINHTGGRADGSTGLSRRGETVYGQFFGQSSFATHCLANEQQATRLRKDLDLTLAPAFACGVQTGAGAVLNGLKPTIGDSIVVVGTGAVGMAALMAAKVMGCTTIIAADVSPERLKLAEELGATHTINPTEVDDLVDVVHDIVPGGVDFAVEAAGRTNLVEAAVQTLKKGGYCAALGVDLGGASVSIPHYQLAMTGVRIGGFPGGLAVPDVLVPRLIQLFEQGHFPVDKLVKNFAFEDINGAAKAAGRGGAIKPILIF